MAAMTITVIPRYWWGWNESELKSRLAYYTSQVMTTGQRWEEKGIAGVAPC